MFTMAKIRDGRTYLSTHLTANDYYCENETVTGRWLGAAAERLGLRGDIHGDDAAFERLRCNRHPQTGKKLTARDKAAGVRFFDFQCSAQKSVSVMAVTMGDDRLLAAHDRAAALAFGELEKFAATRANVNRKRVIRITGNLAAAAFRHTASRALDPQAHTHFVVANATWDEEARGWRALTEYEMLRAIRYAGKVYQNELAVACRALGYEVADKRDERGVVTGFEIVGVPEEVCERFSKRRAEVEKGIEAFRQKHGREPTTAEIHAITVDSRNVKLRETTTGAVLTAQREQLSPVELAGLRAVRREAEEREARPPELPMERESLIQAVGHLYERRSVVAGHEVLAEALNQNLGQIDLGRLHAQAEKTSLVALTDEDWTRAHFATPRGLAEERWAIEFVGRGHGRFPSLGRGTVGAGSRLSPPQREAVNEVLASRDQVICMRGAAGVGKTTMVKELHGILSADGRAMYYCAPTSSAADTLRQDGLATATTVADFLQNVSLRERDRLPGAVLVVDEAGLASNVQGGDLLRISEQYGTRVVFLGDSKQHTSVEAGDFLRILETHSPLHRVEVTEIRRQEVAEYRSAVKLMAVGTARAGLERLDELGWVHEGRAEYLRAAVDDYLARSQDGKRLDAVIAVTPTWRELDAFTAMLRDELKTRGVLGTGERLTVHDPLPWTRAQQARPGNYTPGLVVTFNRKAPGWTAGETAEVARVEGGEVWLRGDDGERRLPLGEADFSVARPREIEVAPGDRLLIRANDRRQGLINGETLTVAALREGGVIETAEGRRIDTAGFRRFSHGFAVTSHKSQSKTADHVVVAAERLNGKAAYVACSRGRYTCTVHTPDKKGLMEELPEGNRLAALDFLGGGATPPPSKITVRERAWETARDWLRRTAEHVAQRVQAVGRVWGHDGLHAPTLDLPGARVDPARSTDTPGDGRSRL